jgi:hypothetical protein
VRNRITEYLTGAERLTYRSERFLRFHQGAWFARQVPDPARCRVRTWRGR